jgi:hypothetical protein
MVYAGFDYTNAVRIPILNLSRWNIPISARNELVYYRPGIQ